LGIVEKNNYDGLGEYEKANIKLMRDEYDKKIRVPKELIEESSKLTNAAFAAWVRHIT
jgi:Zn-dependent M32 family carboxypeptidase